ncbi:NAD(P)H-quinone oxidoreductase subunit S, chloroplastic [Iris pallida]|uniref:NAD(P)H-quinone oxidoreductase subunit S, chloroplastic n=1 Tax=Iris pallida TaxID=29817 RepID=A0AAX6G669_IRIPA|nr:NAD(P)H-quinone oxidoreductase subunit S, chloroplastic [Iris pallida]
MATSIPIHTITPLLSKSSFLRRTRLSPSPSPSTRTTITPSAKFNLSEIMGGRGLCNGEVGIQKELSKPFEPIPTSPSSHDSTSLSSSPLPPQPSALTVSEEAFEKELLGLTGGFPGGEKGLKKFLQENPPPKKKRPSEEKLGIAPSGSKPRAPELPPVHAGDDCRSEE